jgi:isoleucyl-tRNA synthetase
LTILNFENLQKSISDNKDYIKSETLTKELVFVDELSNVTEIEIDTIKSRILIVKM